MSAITYKCPNCGGELVFDPASQKYRCEYCASEFEQQQLERMKPAEGEERTEEHADREEDAQQKQSESSRAVFYSCPSCGAQIVTDETTAATFCYYCHNPVVLEGRLSGEYLPDQIIPFAIDRKMAVGQFQKYIRKKKFVPKAFF
jgi:DNA-directed RNA polymerase subunit RPC12/RpoP